MIIYITHNLLTLQGRIITDNIIHANTDGESHSLFDRDTLDLFGVEFRGRSVDDGGSELAQVQNLGTGDALRDETQECQVDDFGCLLILCADVADILKRRYVKG